VGAPCIVCAQHTTHPAAFKLVVSPKPGGRHKNTSLRAAFPLPVFKIPLSFAVCKCTCTCARTNARVHQTSIGDHARKCNEKISAHTSTSTQQSTRYPLCAWQRAQTTQQSTRYPKTERDDDSVTTMSMAMGHDGRDVHEETEAERAP